MRQAQVSQRVDEAARAGPDGGAATSRRAGRAGDCEVVGRRSDWCDPGRFPTDADLQPYLRAFDANNTDPARLLLVATGDAQVLATMQLSFLPGLARRGALRAQIEAVRVGRTTAAGALELRCSSGQSKRRAAGTAPWSS